MSQSKLVSGGSADSGVDTEKYTYWDIDCDDKRVRVFVNNLEIPTTFVQTHESQDGPASYNQLTEIHLPIQWEGSSVVDEIDVFDPDSYDGYDRVLIQRQNAQTGEWMNHQYGFVRNVGGTNERGVVSMWIADPSMLTTAIEYGNTFDDAKAVDMAQSIGQTFVDETVFEDIEVDIEWTYRTGEKYTTGNPSPRRLNIDTSFQSNRHTLADALQWVATFTDTEWWFEYTDEQLILHFGERETTTWTSDHVDAIPSNGSFPGEVNEINIIQNEALTEITPPNVVQVGGKGSKSIGGFRVKQLSGEYPYARAEYPPLVQRAGQYVNDRFQQVEAWSIEEAENIAKEKLRDAILNSGHGEITLYGTPEMEVGDEIHAIPECADEYIADVKPFTFQITDLEHTKKALEEYVTEATVAPRVNEDLIEVTESRMKDQQNQ